MRKVTTGSRLEKVAANVAVVYSNPTKSVYWSSTGPRIPLRNMYTKISAVNFGLVFLKEEEKKAVHVHDQQQCNTSHNYWYE